MPKCTTTIYIEGELLDLAKRNKINLSQTISEYLKTMFLQDQKINNININQEKAKYERINKELMQKKAELDTIKNNINKYQQAKETEDLKKLEEEEARIKKLNTCYNCGSELLANAKYKFNKVTVCKDCFLNSTKKQRDKWTNK